MNKTPAPFTRYFGIEQLPHYRKLYNDLPADAALQRLTHASRHNDGEFGVEEIDRVLPRGEREGCDGPVSRLVAYGYIEVIGEDRWRVVRFAAEQYTTLDRYEAEERNRRAANTRWHGTPNPERAASSERQARNSNAPAKHRENRASMHGALHGAMQDRGLSSQGSPPPPLPQGGEDLRSSDLDLPSTRACAESPASPASGVEPVERAHPRSGSRQEDRRQEQAQEPRLAAPWDTLGSPFDSGEWPSMSNHEAMELLLGQHPEYPLRPIPLGRAEVFDDFLEEVIEAAPSDETPPETVRSAERDPAPAGPSENSPGDHPATLAEGVPYWAEMVEMLTPKQPEEAQARARAAAEWDKRQAEILLCPEMRELARAQETARAELRRRMEQQRSMETGT